MTTTGRIGILVPSSNTTVEPEFYRALPAGVTVHAARLYLTKIEPGSIQAIVDELDRAASLLATADVDVIMLAATAPSFLKGRGYDRELIGRIEEVTGKRATTTSTAMLRALDAMHARRVALGSAYTETVNDVAAAFVEANGFEIVAKGCLGYEDNLVVGRLDVETAYELGRRVDRPEADAVLLACTNWQTMAVIERLEQAIGKPVLSTSQVSVWDALRQIGYRQPVPGYGRLLAEMPEFMEGEM